MQQNQKNQIKLKIIQDEDHIYHKKNKVLTQALKKLKFCKNSYQSCSKCLTKGVEINQFRARESLSPQRYNLNKIPLLNIKRTISPSNDRSLQSKRMKKVHSKKKPSLWLPTLNQNKKMNSETMLEVEQQINQRKKKDISNISTMISRYEYRNLRKSVNLCYLRYISQLPDRNLTSQNTPKTIKNAQNKIHNFSSKQPKERRVLKTQSPKLLNQFIDLSPWNQSSQQVIKEIYQY